MTSSTKQPVEERILKLLQYLGIEKANFAACMSRDWRGLITSHRNVVSSLTLICPNSINFSSFSTDPPRLLVISGDQGKSCEEIRRVLPNLPNATLMTLHDYYSPTWADVMVDRTEEVNTAILDFLGTSKERCETKVVTLPEGEGEVAKISYRIQGAGPPLVLFPLALAPSQWQPLLPKLAKQYCTITLGGPALGMVASLEARAQGYLRVVRSIIDAADPRAGDQILEVGCGSGVVLRWLAQHTHETASIVGVDINPYLLREAAALVRKERFNETIKLQEGNAENLPFRDSIFDITMACTVLEEGNADQMLSEMVRVTKPRGKVVVIVRSIDLPGVVNLPLRSDLKNKAEIQTGNVGIHGCADSSLYLRMHQAGLFKVTKIPQWASYSEGERLEDRQERITAILNSEELKEWKETVAQSEKDGTFFIAQPFHCAVGTKP